jgi:regulatory protein
MPQVTAIKPQKNGKRVNIYLDGKFAFGLDLENYVKLGLKVEQNLTDDEINGLVKKAEFQKIMDKLLRFATLRPRSEKEIKDYFKRKRVYKDLQKDLYDKLKKFELVDDEKFAKWWVEQRLAFRPKSQRILNNELRIKGVRKDIIDETLNSIKIDEVKIARELIEKRKNKWHNLGEFEARKKMSEFLARHGFAWGIIKTVIKELKT